MKTEHYFAGQGLLIRHENGAFSMLFKPEEFENDGFAF